MSYVEGDQLHGAPASREPIFGDCIIGGRTRSKAGGTKTG